MHYVYRLVSTTAPSQSYIGSTGNLRKRLQYHNTAQTHSTAAFAPWRVQTYFAFDSKPRAQAFERYLKTGSGFAFGSKRLW